LNGSSIALGLSISFENRRDKVCKGFLFAFHAGAIAVGINAFDSAALRNYEVSMIDCGLDARDKLACQTLKRSGVAARRRGRP
jgi:hypothetical protein